MNFYPDYDILYKIKDEYDLLPLMYEEMADMITPVQLLNRLSGDGPCFLLESAESGESFRRYSFIGTKPNLSIKVKNGNVWINEYGTVSEKPVSNPLSEIKKLLKHRTSPIINGLPAFTGGLVGYFGYDTVRYVETTVNNPPPDDTDQYDLQLLGFNDVIVIDHLKHKLIIISNIDTKGDFEKNYKSACRTIQELLQKTKSDSSPAPSARRCHPVTSTLVSKERYMQNVERAVNYIKEGDIFQVVPSQRFCVEDAPDPFNVYRVLRAENPSPYMYFLQLDDCYVAGTSPEKLVSVDKGVVTNHPIAGTIRRGRDDEEDKQLMEKLLSDSKERAEHTMLVDLGRNDLGKICRFGSVKVEEFMKIEKYSRLMHIVSTVTGRLDEDKDCVDALAAVLPAGTLSGAPKVRAMQIIDELETARRGLYGGSQVSYLTQTLGLTVQNFVSAATGIAVLFALIRGFIKVNSAGLGSFWVDITRIIIHILMPLNLVIALCLVGGGVIQNFKPAETVALVEPIAVDAEGEIIEGAVINVDTGTVTLSGETVQGAEIITEQFVPMGPAASQVAIKQSGSNGGGYMGVNSAHPLENPNAFTNIIEMLSLLLIPASLCFSFGKAVNNKKQGAAIFAAMFICLVIALGCVTVSEQTGTQQLAQNGAVDMIMSEQSGGNMEGKETRFGIAASSAWAVYTTAASNGSVNSMHGSFTPLGGMIMMLLMQLGEVIFGGAGCGLYGMLSFAILTVFIAGLMVGRTPEFLGKKIEPYEMKWSVLVCLATPIAILVGSGIAAAVPEVADSLTGSGAHGFSKMLYAYSSCGANNGSAFAGFAANTPFLNVSLGLVMLFARFVPIIGTLAIAGSLAGKKKIATTAGTLSTTNAMFVFLLIIIVLLVGALSFFPALALGPLAEFFVNKV